VSEFHQNKLPDVPSCLVLDVSLPGLSGLEFQTELAKANIQIPIGFMTGRRRRGRDRTGADRSHERVTRRPGKTLSFGNVAAAVRETSDISICSSRAQAGDQMALEPEDVPDRDGFSCFSGVVGGLQETHDLRRSSPASNGPAVEGRSTRR
jgi:CheY-like chemotaxis protein